MRYNKCGCFCHTMRGGPCHPAQRCVCNGGEGFDDTSEWGFAPRVCADCHGVDGAHIYPCVIGHMMAVARADRLEAALREVRNRCERTMAAWRAGSGVSDFRAEEANDILAIIDRAALEGDEG